MIVRLAYLGLFAALAAAVAAAPADARSKGNKRDPTFQLRSSADDFVKVSPGDHAFDGAGVRLTGPEQGVFIERCYWTLNNPFYGPLNPTQRCVRYTLENTE